ncbi:50S ribosomal protein L22 [Tetrabaena socialis]|uniref:50S ribosomal protein L22 n=1 Tax=Tetrabaena socialis TaxID=47790 RepID=A0A2J8A7S5_9CHLO|nr:50S ribosomal protein L22 [Tetrabaena socialis]|eukprot:PNH08584.1 50S ribosomal protein L22 [Tetrabaena socialis]
MALLYDERDEREERRKELKREAYGGAGTVYLLDVPQSMKKMDRIVRLVRGLSYPEAVAQCTLVPHKAAKYVLQALEHAHEDAVRDKKLVAERLVVDTIFVTKGLYQKGMRPMGKGNTGSNTIRKSHLRVVLEQVEELPAATARVVPPLMSAWRGPAVAARGGAPGHGSGAGSWAPQKPRFAYRSEV